MKNILAINPGSTSTKVALFEASDSWHMKEIGRSEVSHDRNELEECGTIAGQKKLRSRGIEAFLKDSGNPILHAVAGRGGLTKPLEAGSYAINQAMKADLIAGRYGEHASNLGALIAEELAETRSIPALIADPVGVDQFHPLARYSGHPDIPRLSQLHALNMRAVAREAAMQMGGKMEDYNFVIAHLGGGISISPMSKGRLLDANHAMDGGPFSPQRAGALPTMGLVEACFSGRWSNKREALGELTRRSGLIAYLGTDDGKEIERRAIADEQPWKETYQAMAYQISKEIAAMASVLQGQVDAIILTGGLPHPPLSDWIKESTSWIAPIRIHPGERELLALGRAAARYLYGEEELRVY